MTKLRPVKTAQAIAYYRRSGQPDKVHQLENHLTAAGRCKRCGRTLTDPSSLADGIGPECAGKDQSQ